MLRSAGQAYARRTSKGTSKADADIVKKFALWCHVRASDAAAAQRGPSPSSTFPPSLTSL